MNWNVDRTHYSTFIIRPSTLKCPTNHKLSKPVTVALQLAIVAFLVLLNGFFVASEFALVSVRNTRIDQLAAEGSSAAAKWFNTS